MPAKATKLGSLKFKDLPLDDELLENYERIMTTG